MAFTNILVATDFGDASQRAADLASTFATKLQAQLTIMYVLSVPLPAYAENVTVPLDEMLAGAQKALDLEATRLRVLNPGVKTLLVQGSSPSRAILDAVEEQKFDALVIGTHGRHGLQRAFLGSVAEKLVRLAAVPVLTVHAKEKG